MITTDPIELARPNIIPGRLHSLFESICTTVGGAIKVVLGEVLLDDVVRIMNRNLEYKNAKAANQMENPQKRQRIERELT